MSSQIPSLADLGWTSFFSSQISAEELETAFPARVMAAHRGHLVVIGEDGELTTSPFLPDAQSEEDHPTVGDWLLVDRHLLRPVRVLDRTSVFRRRAAGTGHRVQTIAANVDTLLIVSSCNHDFSIARLERYLVLAREAGVMPVIVLTKSDLADGAEDYAIQARKLQPGLCVETVNALDPDSIAPLTAWCGKGQTVAFMGSSGVGKSTLINTLTGQSHIATQGIREDDGRGRHTTTNRSMHRLEKGGWLLDTPGMRELQLADAAEGIGLVFEDIIALAQQCRFGDCRHLSEPDCAVRAALESGALDPARYRRWRKLAAEEAFNSETLAEHRARDRAFGKMARSVLKGRRDGKP